MVINELVQRLSEGKHEIVIGHRDEPLEEIKKRIKDGYIHIKFTQTKGGTELGISVDLEKTNINEIEANREGRFLHLEGVTSLNYNKVRCIADINLTTNTGEGHLEIVA